jgi:hypothetical protein
MSGIQIALLIAGGIICIISFFVPGRRGRKENLIDVARLTEEQVKFMVEKEIDDTRQHIQEVVDETLTYAMEKGERSMDRITNEKMLAINEYSDTVLGEINRNQQEVVFLYDMMNDKQQALKKMVSQAAVTTSELQKAVREVEVSGGSETGSLRVVSSRVLPDEIEPNNKGTVEINPDASFQLFPVGQFDTIVPNRVIEAPIVENNGVLPWINEESYSHDKLDPVPYREADPVLSGTAVITTDQAGRNLDMHFNGSNEGNRNNNERILRLHKSGWSNIDVARELGLGVGEVKLVIDLFEGAD